jgi:ankyrin repeat protein
MCCSQESTALHALAAHADADGRTALCAAAENGHVEAITALLLDGCA